MAVPPAPDQRSGVVNSPDTTVSAPSRARRVIALVLTGVMVACLLVIGFVFVTDTDAPGRSAADRAKVLVQGDEDLKSERSEVLGLAQQFMLRVNTYGPSDLNEDNQMPDYRERVGSIITPKFKASFDQGVEAAEQSVAQAGVGRTAQIFGAGVSSIDLDSARVLVGGSFTVSYPNDQDDSAERVEVEPSPFRVEVNLVKIDGTWLIDDFVPVSGVDTGGTPTLPPADPTDPASPAPSDGESADPADPAASETATETPEPSPEPSAEPSPSPVPSPSEQGGTQ